MIVLFKDHDDDYWIVLVEDGVVDFCGMHLVSKSKWVRAVEAERITFQSFKNKLKKNYGIRG